MTRTASHDIQDASNCNDPRSHHVRTGWRVVEWSCAPVDRTGKDIDNALTLTVPPAAIVTIAEAAEAIAKRRQPKQKEEW